MGAPKKSMPRPSKAQTTAIEQAVARGLRPSQIMRQLGYSYETVRAVRDAQDAANAARPRAAVVAEELAHVYGSRDELHAEQRRVHRDVLRAAMRSRSAQRREARRLARGAAA